MLRPPPNSTRTYTLFPYTPPFRSCPQTVVPCSRIRLRCSACFTARGRTRPRIPALRLARLRDRRAFHAPPAGLMGRVQFQTPEKAAGNNSVLRVPRARVARKSVVTGTRWGVRVELGGCGRLQKKTQIIEL